MTTDELMQRYDNMIWYRTTLFVVIPVTYYMVCEVLVSML